MTTQYRAADLEILALAEATDKMRKELEASGEWARLRREDEMERREIMAEIYEGQRETEYKLRDERYKG